MLLPATGWSYELHLAEHSLTIPMDRARRDLPALPTVPASRSPGLGVGVHRCCPKVTAVTQGSQPAPHGLRSHPVATSGTPTSQLPPLKGCHPRLAAATPRSPLPPGAHSWYIGHLALTAAPASAPGWLPTAQLLRCLISVKWLVGSQFSK